MDKFMLFMIAYAICSILVGLITEALKKAFDWSGRITVLAVSVVVPILVVVAYSIIASVQFTVNLSLGMIMLMLASWLGATLGYDTIKDAIQEINDIIHGKSKTDEKK